MATSTSKTETGKNVNDALAEVSSQIESLRKDFSGLAESISNYGVSWGQQVAGRATDTATTAAEKAQDIGRVQAQRLSGQANEFKSQTKNFVTRQPQTALGVALAIGFLIGYWTPRN